MKKHWFLNVWDRVRPFRCILTPLKGLHGPELFAAKNPHLVEPEESLRFIITDVDFQAHQNFVGQSDHQRGLELLQAKGAPINGVLWFMVKPEWYIAEVWPIGFHSKGYIFKRQLAEGALK